VTVRTTDEPPSALIAAWDELVDRTPGTDVTQLSAWSRVRRECGYAPLYLFAVRGGELVGGAQILTRRVPLVGWVGYLAYGPLVAPGAPSPGDIRAGLTTVLAGLGRGSLAALFVQPPEGTEHVSDELFARGFRRSAAGIAPAGSIRVDLTAELARIRSRFGRSLRSWTNRWEGRGVTVRTGDERDLPLLNRLMACTATQRGFRALPAGYVDVLYRELAPTGHAALFVGQVNGLAVAASVVTCCGSMIRGRLDGFDRAGEAARLSVPAATRWQIIQWGKARGYRWLDFGGLQPVTLDILLAGGEPPAEGWPAVDQPKVTFGGMAFRYPQAVEMIASPAVRAAYDLARRSQGGRRALDVARAVMRGRPSSRRLLAAGREDGDA
jgi:hypothetical protein